MLTMGQGTGQMFWNPEGHSPVVPEKSKAQGVYILYIYSILNTFIGTYISSGLIKLCCNYSQCWTHSSTHLEPKF